MTNGAGEQPEHVLSDEFGLNALREVLRLIGETDITEIKIERGGSKLHIRRGQPAPVQNSTPRCIRHCRRWRRSSSMARARPQPRAPQPATTRPKARRPAS